jgi:hypothetical protein
MQTAIDIGLSIKNFSVNTTATINTASESLSKMDLVKIFSAKSYRLLPPSGKCAKLNIFEMKLNGVLANA